MDYMIIYKILFACLLIVILSFLYIFNNKSNPIAYYVTAFIMPFPIMIFFNYDLFNYISGMLVGFILLQLINPSK